MPDLKISQLTDGNPAESNDQIPINRGGANFRITAGSISALGVEQSDIGTDPNEIPLNQYLGTMAFQDATAITVGQAAIDDLDATSLTVSSGSTLNGGVVINELGADADTRIEGDTDANLFFVDASTDRIGVGTASPSNKLTVSGSANFTGNVALGDASTDTVTVNGYMGVGGAASSDAGITMTSNALVGAAQSGIQIRPVATSSATTSIRAIVARADTAAASFTVADAVNFWAAGVTKGAGSTITNQHGVYIVDQTQGTNNYGITSLVSSGTNKWNIYASGTADNYFAGNVGIGTSSPGAKLDVRGSAIFNEDGADADFRVESDTNTHALFVEGTNSNVKIGGSAERATTVGTNHLDIFDGTAPVGTLANGVSFYSASGEANVMDAAGNATLLSPHDAETNEWIFRSKHTPTGKVLRIDVERLLKFVNDHFGLDAVHEFIEE